MTRLTILLLVAGCVANKPHAAPMRPAEPMTYHLDDADPGHISEDNLFRVQVLRTGFEFARCESGPAIPLSAGCETWDLDGDGDVDQADFGFVQEMMR